MSDEDILQLHRESGKSSYFGDLFIRYLPVIYGVCLKYLKERDKARKVVLQLYDDLLNKITGYEIDAFEPWIYNVIKNYCLQVLRKETPYIKISLKKGEVNIDNFSQDAIEGFDMVKNSLVKKDLEIMKKYIRKKSKNKINYLQLFSIAACILIFFCISVYYMFFENKDVHSDTPHIETVAENVKNLFFADIFTKVEKKDKDIDIAEKKNPQKIITLEKKDTIVLAPRQEKVRETEVNSRNINIYQDLQQVDYYENYFPVNYSDHSLSNIEVQEYLAGHNRPKAVVVDDSQTSDSKPATGEESFKNYIEKNLKELPENAFDDQHGKVILMFKVNEKGRPIDIVVLRSLCQSADKEAIRILEDGPDWTKGNNYARLEISF